MKNPLRIRHQAVECENRTLFLNSSALQVGFNAGQLEIRDGKELLGAFPVEPLDRVIVAGNPQITTQAVKACLCRGITIVYHDVCGRLLGVTEPSEAKDSSRRIEQYRLVTSEIRRLAWAKSLIRAKFRSAAIEFRRMVDNGWHFGDRKFKNAMRRAAAEAEAAASLPELSGIEGLAAREYFGIFGAALPGDFVWLGRHYRPASDPVNALLSFTYGVTAGRLEEGCRRHGLDHRLAFLHRNGYGSGGLSADLIEPLRSAWCDHLVLWTLHRGAIDAEDFRFDGAACRLSEDGRRKYLALLQRLLLPRLEKAAKPLFGMVCKSLAEPDRIPDFSSLLPER